MSMKTTRKAIVNNYPNVRSAGYCDLQALLRNHEPIAHTKNGIYHAVWDGWSATTGRHIKAFSGMNKREYMRLLDND